MLWTRKTLRALRGMTLAGALILLAPRLESAAGPATIDVQFKLTDLDYRPIPGAAVRLVLGDQPGAQPLTSGYRFVTDAQGAHRFDASAAIDQRLKKIPTNFVDSLFSRPRTTDHLAVAAELDYAGHRWLYAIEVFRIPEGGDVLLDGFSVYTPDARGQFTNKASYDGKGWRMADLGGMMLTTPGYDPWDFSLAPEQAPGRWTLKLAFKKYPEPVRR